LTPAKAVVNLCSGGDDMPNKKTILGIFMVGSAFVLFSLGQFTQEETAERAKWEEYLQTADIQIGRASCRERV
jgi:hypothetical protein